MKELDQTRLEFEKEFLQEYPEKTCNYSFESNTYSEKDTQSAWWAWQKKQDFLEQSIENIRHYQCDCGFLDSNDLDDLNESRIDEAVENRIKEKITLLIQRGNDFGLEDLICHLNEIGFSYGKKLHQKHDF